MNMVMVDSPAPAVTCGKKPVRSATVEYSLRAGFPFVPLDVNCKISPHAFARFHSGTRRLARFWRIFALSGLACFLWDARRGRLAAPACVLWRPALRKTRARLYLPVSWHAF